jgi:hypothetical protein
MKLELQILLLGITLGVLSAFLVYALYLNWKQDKKFKNLGDKLNEMINNSKS